MSRVFCLCSCTHTSLGPQSPSLTHLCVVAFCGPYKTPVCHTRQGVRAGLSLHGGLGFLDRAQRRASEQGQRWGLWPRAPQWLSGYQPRPLRICLLRWGNQVESGLRGQGGLVWDPSSRRLVHAGTLLCVFSVGSGTRWQECSTSCPTRCPAASRGASLITIPTVHPLCQTSLLICPHPSPAPVPPDALVHLVAVPQEGE